MVRAKNPMPNTLSLDMRCEEGRCLVQVDIDFLNAGERQFLFRLLEEAKEGRQVGFSVDSHENGEHIVKFTLGMPAEMTPAEMTQ